MTNHTARIATIIDCLVLMLRELTLLDGEVSEACWHHRELNRVASL